MNFDHDRYGIVYISKLREDVNHKVFFNNRTFSKSKIIGNGPHVLENFDNWAASLGIFDRVWIWGRLYVTKKM